MGGTRRAGEEKRDDAGSSMPSLAKGEGRKGPDTFLLHAGFEACTTSVRQVRRRTTSLSPRIPCWGGLLPAGEPSCVLEAVSTTNGFQSRCGAEEGDLAEESSFF